MSLSMRCFTCGNADSERFMALIGRHYPDGAKRVQN